MFEKYIKSGGTLNCKLRFYNSCIFIKIPFSNSLTIEREQEGDKHKGKATHPVQPSLSHLMPICLHRVSPINCQLVNLRSRRPLVKDHHCTGRCYHRCCSRQWCRCWFPRPQYLVQNISLLSRHRAFRGEIPSWSDPCVGR